MNSKVFFVILLIIGGLVVYGVSASQEETTQANASQAQMQKVESQSELQAQSKRLGAVDVEITPLQLESGQELVFEVSLNTHSVELDYDFTQIVTAEDNLGNSFQAQDWTGEVGGHHLSGTVIFGSLPSNVNAITLNVDGIDNESATFSWKI